MKTKKTIAMFTMIAILFMNCCNPAKAEEATATATDTAKTEQTEANASTEENNTADASADADSDTKSKKTTKKADKKDKKAGEAKTSYTKKELRYMAAIIYCEAANQSYAGKLAVGIVVKNRMESKKFPSTIKGVLYQKYQFTPARNGALSKALKIYDKNGFKTKSYYRDCLKAAKQALSGVKTVKVKGKEKNMKGYYFFSRYVSGCRLKIGAHMFK